MSISRTSFAVAALMLGATSIAGAQAAKAQKDKPKATHAAGHLKLTAPDFVSKGRITLAHVFNGMGCNGQNISPALSGPTRRRGRNRSPSPCTIRMRQPEAAGGTG